MIWKQFLGSLARFVLMALFGALVSKGIISQEMADQLTESGAFYVVSAILLLLPIGWQWLKTRFNVQVLEAARNAAPDTPLSEIRKTVLKEAFNKIGKLSLPV